MYTVGHAYANLSPAAVLGEAKIVLPGSACIRRSYVSLAYDWPAADKQILHFLFPVGAVGRNEAAKPEHPKPALMSATQIIYEGVNDIVLSLVPPAAMRILDVGCGTGTFGQCLRQQRERYVVGITYSEREAEMASPRLSKVHCADLNHFDFNQLGTFDCIVLSHILEHLVLPDQILEQLKPALEPEGVIIVALPNVVWWKQRLQFLVGKWKYQDWGILDRTHLRFFDRRSSAALLEDAGYEILQRTTHGPFPVLKPIRKYMGSWAGKIDRWTSATMPGLLAMQFVYVARLKKQTAPPSP